MLARVDAGWSQQNVGNKKEKESLEKKLFELAYPRLSRELREKESPYPPLDEEGRIISIA